MEAGFRKHLIVGWERGAAGLRWGGSAPRPGREAAEGCAAGRLLFGGAPEALGPGCSNRHRHLVVLIHAFPFVQDRLGFVRIQLGRCGVRGGGGCAGAPQSGAVLTHFISRSVKMRLSRHMRSGTVRMRSTAKHASCSPVKRCMRSVRTCRGAGVRACGTPRPPHPRPAPLLAAWLPQAAPRPPPQPGIPPAPCYAQPRCSPG